MWSQCPKQLELYPLGIKINLLFSSMSAYSADSSSWYPLCPSSHGEELEKPRVGNFSPFLPLWLWLPPLTVWGRRGDDTQFVRSLKNPDNGESPCSYCPGLMAIHLGLSPPPSLEIIQQWELNYIWASRAVLLPSPHLWTCQDPFSV